MEGVMGDRIWFCYTRTAIGKSISEVGKLQNRVP
jgi:hypothetical protein